MLELHLVFLIDLMTLKPFSFKFVALLAYFWVFVTFFYIKKMCSAQKTSLPIRASANYNALAPKAFFQKFTCRGKQASTYVGPCAAALANWPITK